MLISTEIARLLLMTTCDLAPREHAPRVAYIFAQTSDNQASVLEKGALLYRGGIVNTLALCDGETAHGYPGYQNWRTELLLLGVQPKDIVSVLVDVGVNTFSEATALVKHCRWQHFHSSKHNWDSIYIVAPPFHQLRAFISVVSVALHGYPEFRIYNQPGNSFDWHERVRHSQGTLEATRQELIDTELERIERYYEKGDLVSLAEVFKYLKQRDQR